MLALKPIGLFKGVTTLPGIGRCVCAKFSKAYHVIHLLVKEITANLHTERRWIFLATACVRFPPQVVWFSFGRSLYQGDGKPVKVLSLSELVSYCRFHRESVCSHTMGIAERSRTSEGAGTAQVEEVHIKTVRTNWQKLVHYTQWWPSWSFIRPVCTYYQWRYSFRVCVKTDFTSIPADFSVYHVHKFRMVVFLCRPVFSLSSLESARILCM